MRFFIEMDRLGLNRTKIACLGKVTSRLIKQAATDVWLSSFVGHYILQKANLGEQSNEGAFTSVMTGSFILLTAHTLFLTAKSSSLRNLKAIPLRMVQEFISSLMIYTCSSSAQKTMLSLVAMQLGAEYWGYNAVQLTSSAALGSLTLHNVASIIEEVTPEPEGIMRAFS